MRRPHEHVFAILMSKPLPDGTTSLVQACPICCEIRETLLHGSWTEADTETLRKALLRNWQHGHGRAPVFGEVPD